MSIEVEITGTISEVSDLKQGNIPRRYVSVEVPNGDYKPQLMEISFTKDKAENFSAKPGDEVTIKAFLGGWKNNSGYINNTLQGWTVDVLAGNVDSSEDQPF